VARITVERLVDHLAAAGHMVTRKAGGMAPRSELSIKDIIGNRHVTHQNNKSLPESTALRPYKREGKFG
jgi:hypothetical protein